MSDFRISTLQDLKRHAKRVGNDFFGIGNKRYFGQGRYYGIYRGSQFETFEGYVIAEAVFEPSGAEAPVHSFTLYRFEASDEWLKFYYIGTHESLADAEAFLSAMGVTR
ncbi:hypothetical protein CQ020_03655 [Arthrobacter sp. MYb23]|uniref:hypothetical protein n=1 Tax=unclassified Arthrobacter TaxID=235627 RepID=UPI000CFA80BB|nr:MULTISPECIES: hypothetical protein [unclassified Arthrobacter]PRB44316.1 hypothetical protein CQ038_03510 [Arthrobacter sp. MYb51]PRB98568.1 hypothetical protein CQ020_03655 [Arthrobacter sp. MYb23]